MKRLLTPLAAACLLAAVAPSLAAAPYTGLYVFGDSLSDAGQFPDPGGPDGATRRFTNRVGPTYLSGNGEVFALNATQILSLKLGLGSLTGSTSPVNAALGLPDGNNWAVGGNTTSQVLDSITGSGEGSVVELVDGTNLRQRDAFLVDLASRGQSLDSNALYYVNGGGNDFLDFLVLNVPAATASAGRLMDSVNALQQAGARYIMVPLLGDLSQTPFALGAGLSGFIAPLASAFNTELVRQLATVNAEIIPLNVPLLVKEVLASPASYGLAADQNLSLTCFSGCANVNPVYGISGTTPDPSKLLFNDSVHPTIAAQQAFADYAASLLAAPWEITLLPEMAYGTLRAHEGQLRNQWQADAEAWQSEGQWRSFVTGAGQQLDIDKQAAGASADGSGYSLSLGGSYRLDDAWRVGLALGLYEQKLQAGEENSNYQVQSTLASAFAQYQQNRWWADLALTGGYLDYNDLKRKFAIGQATRGEKGDTTGDLWSLSGRLGYDIAQPGSQWHLSPFVSAEYARVEVDGYSENGSTSTALNYADQVRKSRQLGAGVQGRFQLSPQTLLFAEVVRNREYADDSSDVRIELNSLPGIDFTLDGYTPDDSLVQASVGVSQKLTSDLSLRATYSYSHASSVDQQGVGLSLSLEL